MNNSTLPYWLSLMVVLAASYGGWKWYQVEQFQKAQAVGGIEFKGPPLDEFELTERSGLPFRSSEMLGKVWVTTFFFATCPGNCERLNSSIKYLNSLEELKDVTWVSITVDPDTDTLPELQKYADRFQADSKRWLFCRADFAYVKRVGVEVMKQPVTWKGHNEMAVVIGKSGKIRGMYDASRISQAEKLRELLVECLAEETTPAASTEATKAQTEEQPAA